MSFILKHPRLTAGIVEFTRHTKFTLRKKRFLFSPCHCTFEIKGTFVRTCAVAPQKYDSPSKTRDFQDTLYQKSIAQLYFDIRYKGYILREDLNDAWHTLKTSTPFTIEQTVLLIRNCGHSLPLERTSEKLNLVKEIWDSFDHIGIEKTIHHYNALLSVYVELGHNFCPKDFLRALEKQGLHPNLGTYMKLIHALSIQGKIDNAQELLEHMKRHSVSIDNRVFNCLILGYSLQGDFISARGILELMKEKQLNLCSQSYVYLAMGYAKRGDIDKVMEIVEECKKESKILSVTEFLELAYTFAVSGHSEQFSAILEMIPLKKNFPVVSTKIVHRLLHQNLDKEALTLFEMRDRLQSVNMFREPLQMFLDHYVRFRKPYQVLDMAELYREKGWSSISFAYCLKETLIRKDVTHCLNFLDTMKIRNYPVRIHYFYPILLKTRAYGNKEILKMTQRIRSYHLGLGREIIKAFDNFYNFVPGAELKDFEKLKNLGVDKKLAAWKILQVLLNHGDVTNTIKLVSTCCVAHPNVLLPLSMVNAFGKREGGHKYFVHILYHIIHNLKIFKEGQISNAEVNSYEYEQFIFEIAKSCCESFNLGVLKEMLKNKIPLSPAAASLICRQFSNPEITDLVSNLRAEHLKFEFDESLLKRLRETDALNEKGEFSSEQVEKDSWSQLYLAVKNNRNLPTIMKMFENLTQKIEYPIHKRVQNIVRKTFRFVSEKGDVVSTERIYEVGIQKNLIRADHYAPCFIAQLVKGSSDNAVRRFHEGLKATKKCKSLDILIREIKNKKSLCALEDLKISISKVCGQNFATTKLLLEFARLGLVSETTDLLRYKNEILKPLFKARSLQLFKKGHVRYFETLKEASWKIDTLSKTSFCYPLVRLYALKGDLEKLLTLYVELEREDAMTDTYRNVFFDSFKEWDGDVPHQLQHVFQCVKEDCEMRKSSEIIGSSSADEDIRSYMAVYSELRFDSKPKSVSNINRENNILKCFCLIHGGKIDEYFKFLNEKIAGEKPEISKKYFFCYKLGSHMINQKNLGEYEKLAMTCGSSSALKKYLKLCLRFGSAHSIKTAMNNIGPIPLTFFLQEINYKDCLRVIRSAECHRQLKSKISIFYYKVIKECISQNNFAMATKYYGRVKKHRLESILSSFTNKNPIVYFSLRFRNK